MEHNQKELFQIEKHNQRMMRQMKSVVNGIQSNQFLSQVKKDMTEIENGSNTYENKLYTMKENGIMEGERKMKAR